MENVVKAIKILEYLMQAKTNASAPKSGFYAVSLIQT